MQFIVLDKVIMDRHKLLWINFIVLLMKGWNIYIGAIGKFNALPRSHTLCLLKHA